MGTEGIVENREEAGREDTRDAILDACDRLLSHYGYRKMAMVDVARESGFSRRTVYLYFPTKEQIAWAVLDRGIDHLIGGLREVAEGSGTPDERLRRMLVRRVLTMFDSAKERAHSYAEIIQAFGSEYTIRREGYVRREAEVFATVVEEGMRTGRFRVVDAGEVAGWLLLATNALMPFSLSTRQMQDRDALRHKVEGIADLLVRSLSAASVLSGMPASSY